MSAYYNEHDADKAAWLRELIKAGLIAPGEVDERSIEDVLPNELTGFTQCHFFAGIGIWSYALRLAGWPDDRPVWTGSCPCQPFSAAGKRAGFADERHLWPAWFHLISINRPDVVFGEQTAKKDGLAWLDLVQDDLEAAAYAVGALCLPACGFGAPHLRERIFFVADAAGKGSLSGPQGGIHPEAQGERARNGEPERLGSTGSVGDSHDAGSQGRGLFESDRNGNSRSECPSGSSSVAGRVGNAESNGRIGRENNGNGRRGQCASGQTGSANNLAGVALGDAEGKRCREAGTGSRRPEERIGNAGESSGLAGVAQGNTGGERLEIGSLPDGRRGVVRIKGPTAAETGIVNGVWRDAELILCNDPEGWKWRATEPGSFPLAHGAAARMVIVCAKCKTETRLTNGTTTENRTNQVLQALRLASDAEKAAQRGLRRTFNIQPAAVLRDAMLRQVVASSANDAHRRSGPSESALFSDGMREVRRIAAGEPPSQGSESNEQCVEEYRDTLCRLPFDRTQEARAAFDLRRVWDEFSSGKSSQQKQDLFCVVCEGVGPHMCQKEEIGRIAQLRGYGDGIAAPVAEEFIRAYMELEAKC